MDDEWLKLQARAARSFGVPWDQFDYLTPAQLAMITEDSNDEWLSKQKAIDNMLALVACCVMRAAGAKSAKPQHFLPKYKVSKKTEKQKDRPAQTARQIHAALSVLK